MRYYFFVVLLIPLVVNATPVPDSIAPIAGRYTGTVYNGNDLDPVVTVLAFDDQGRFAGSYRIDDENGSFEGTLSGLVQEGERSYSLEWTDRDGEGFLMLEFNNDYSSFTGAWTDTDGQYPRPYTGKRQ